MAIHIEREEAVKFAESLLWSNEMVALSDYCEQVLEIYPAEVRLWRLWGVALGNLGDPENARSCFLLALDLSPNDGYTLANMITSMFHAGDLDSASSAIDRFFPEMDEESKNVVLMSVLEAIREGMVTKNNLPNCLKDLIK